MNCLKQYLRLWIFCIGISTLQAQNLVPNPSFEEFKTAASCTLHMPKTDFENMIEDWLMPTDASPDIFSTLLPNTCIASQPNSTVYFSDFPTGSQLPRTGNHFAGIAPNISQWYREYLAIKLSSPLIPGELYCCEMYVSLAEGCAFAQGNLGMYFSNSEIYQPGYPTLGFEPQIEYEEAITDSVSWVRISGSFKASNAAQYLVIGNFRYWDSRVSLNKEGVNFSYYYIDDVSVEQIIPPPLNITGNTPVCPGEELNLQATGWSNINWRRNNTTLSTSEQVTLYPQQSGTYTVTGFYCDAKLTQDVMVEVHPIPLIDLGKDVTICKDDTYLIDAGAGLFNYQWQDGSTGQTFLASTSGTYTVTAQNSEGCSNSDAITVRHYKDPSVNLGEDLKTCKPDGSLNANRGLPYERYLWNDGSTGGEYTYYGEGTYWVTVSNPCGAEDSDTITITQIHLFIPNLITPNGDGMNDEFQITGTAVSNEIGTLEIYNRYGSKVYTHHRYNNSWSGEGLEHGIYYYVFQYPTCDDQKEWIQVFK